jgi:Transglutaminase-like superfamily/Domain of Unknown Function with PDB structure (DUF3857)
MRERQAVRTGTRLQRGIACGCLALACCLPVVAQDLGGQSAHWKVKRVETRVQFRADASNVMEYTLEREALSDQGAQLVGKGTRSYHRGLQQHEVLEAYTLKADGRRLPVGADAIQLQSGVAASGTGASMPEMAVVLVTFPDVQRGDRTVLRGRLTTHTPMLPGWAQTAEAIFPVIAFDQVLLRIEAPRALHMNVFSDGFAMKKESAGDSEVWEARASAAAATPDASPVNSLTGLARVYASAWQDHAQLVKAYADQANPKAIVDASVEQLALQITRDKKTPREKAAAVHDWVRRNVRYVAVYLGVGGFVPHDVSWILANRYGDCKDQALLMQTLLKAVGVEAVPVLINSLPEYVLPELPTQLSFNHCILYLPGLELFVDPTDGRIPFGSLSLADSDKPVAVALAGGAKLMRTPAFTPERNHLAVRSVWTVHKSGAATGTVRAEADGYAATALQDRLGQIPPGQGSEAVQKLLAASNMRGTGAALFPPIQRYEQRQKLELNLDVPAFLAEPQAGTVRVHPSLTLPIFSVGFISSYAEERRQLAMGCVPVHVREDFEMRFDPEFKLLRAPDDIKLAEHKGILYEAHYKLEGQVLTGWRELTLDQKQHWCSAAEYAVRRPAMLRIRRNLLSTLLYQQ